MTSQVVHMPQRPMVDMLKKPFTFLVLMFPVLSQYASPIPYLSLGEVLLFIPLPFLFILGIKRNLSFPLYFFFFICIDFVSFFTVIYAPFFSPFDYATRIIRDILYTLIALFASQIYFDLDYGIRLYKKLSIIFSSYLVLQVAAYYGMGIILPWVLPGLPLAGSAVNSQVIGGLTDYFLLYYYRPCSIFIEPAHFAQYVSLSLVFPLFEHIRPSKNNLIYCAFITVAVLLSTSGNGYIFLSVIWGLWVLRLIVNSKSVKLKALSVAFVAFSVVASSFLYQISNTFAEVLNRIAPDRIYVSLYFRVFRGFDIFMQLPVIHQIFGIAPGNLPEAMEYFRMGAQYIESEYVNSIAYILISSGIIGLALFIIAMFMLASKSGFSYTVFAFTMLVACLIASIYPSTKWVMWLSFLVAAKCSSHTFSTFMLSRLNKVELTETSNR